MNKKMVNMVQKIITYVIMVVLLFSFGGMFYVTQGTSLYVEKVYAAQDSSDAKQENGITQIKTYSDLVNASLHADGSYILMADIDMSKAGEAGWKPWNFNGVFDGNGHTLYNMDIKSATDITAKTYDGNLKEYDTYFAGFFGITEGAVISNLNIAGAHIELKENDGMLSKSIFAATLAGYMKDTTIKNCSVEAYISLTSAAKMWGVGGVAGFGNGLIEAVTSDVTLVCIDADTDDTNKDEQFMGGIYADGYADVIDSNVTIDGYISERGYVHSGGIAGLYILYPVSGSYVADIAGNTINGMITFFEDNSDRRAYCKAVAGERMNLYTSSRDNIDNFTRNEVYDYTHILEPENYERKLYTVDNLYESSSPVLSDELIEGADDKDNIIEKSGLKSGKRVLFSGISEAVRVAIIIIVVILAVGSYYFITRYLKRKK